jgi:hypothetical protein
MVRRQEGIDRSRCTRRMTRARVVAELLLVLGISAGLVPTTATAAGGKSIATAPTVTYGQQEFGNTAEDQYLANSCGGLGGAWRSYWNLPVTAGDLLTINWEALPGTHLDLTAAGTTDYTVFDSGGPVLFEELTSNDKAQAQYAAPVSGTMPLYFRVCEEPDAEPGPYSFTATDQHGLSLALTLPPAIQTNSVISASAKLVSGAPVPDGMAFTLSVVGPESTTTYNATSSSGALNFQLALPASTAGKSVTMTVTRAADAEYQAAKSSADHCCRTCPNADPDTEGHASPQATQMPQALQEAGHPRQAQVHPGRPQAA